MKRLLILGCLLSATSPTPAAELAAWVVFPDETVLSGRTACESDRQCWLKLENWGYVIAYGRQGVFDSLVTSPDGVHYGRSLDYDPATSYAKTPLFYYRDGFGGQERYYLGTLYVQIR